jgi:FkbM family methyltransferase
MKRVIYDLGANNGDDVEYYLKKADLVVAVEADPALCDRIRARFAAEIGSGRLVVENCVISEDPRRGATVPFYLRKPEENDIFHILNQYPRPGDDEIDNFTEISLPARSSVEIIVEHGQPHYVKIDIEHYDQVVLKAIFDAGIRPPYISAEAHSIDVLAVFIVNGYSSFKLVEGHLVADEYRFVAIQSSSGPATFSFNEHSAGPFGNDISGPWSDKEDFFRELAHKRLGWKDIHASLVDEPVAEPFRVPPHSYGVRQLARMLRTRIVEKVRS